MIVHIHTFQIYYVKISNIWLNSPGKTHQKKKTKGKRMCLSIYAINIYGVSTYYMFFVLSIIYDHDYLKFNL